MTNKSYFLSQLGFAPSADVIEGAFIDSGLDQNGTYDATLSKSIKTAALNTLQMLLSTADVTQGTGETMNSIRYDRNAILKRIQLLSEQLGVTVGLPTIKRACKW